MKVALLWPDTHAPYHDKKAVQLLLKVLSLIKPNELILLGDFADCYAVTSHAKSARMNHALVDEIEGVNALLDQIDKASSPEMRKVYILGNHEHRLERYIAEKARELFGVTEIEGLLRLEQRGYKVIPYGPRQLYKVLGSKLLVRHEPFGTSAKASATRALTSLAFGHTHRIEESYIVGIEGRQYVSFSCGWLGDDRFQDVFGYNRHNQWQLGFAIVWVDPKTRYFYHQIVPILPNYSCVVNSKAVKL